MAVVIPPPENRAKMAQKPPNKLDAEEAKRVNQERKKGWNSEWAYNREWKARTLTLYVWLDGNMLLAYNAFSKARFWRTKTQQTKALKK